MSDNNDWNDQASSNEDPIDGTLVKRPAGAKPEKPTAEDLWETSRTLFTRGSEVLPFIWIAVFILWMMPLVIKLMLGIDPFNPWDSDLGLELGSLGFQVLAVTLLAASFPIARSYLLGAEEGPRDLGSATDALMENMVTAFPVGLLFSVAVFGGLMLCILPGLLAAAYLAPVLYLATARKTSLFRSFLRAPSQITGYSHFFAIIFSTWFLFFFITAVLAGLGLTASGAGGGLGQLDVSQLDFTPFFLAGFILGFIFNAAFYYCLYIGLTAAFITIESHETGEPLT